MKAVHISQVEEGMITAKDIVTQRGIMLCPKGTTLTKTILERLKRMGIETVFVETPEGKRAKEDEIIRRLDHMRKNVRPFCDSEPMKTIYEAVEEVLKEKLYGDNR